ncbi:30S ribosomal protein S1 [Pueribacillus theae]|uniref:30S ribosomal protein S1 n=1 Tax=Pueribacillus theae TaxID=2171751 RepID=A0A2U1K4D6_9BACI|nr:30S ribosomal protein S1 [Pueribacillus theae]PWA12390.1 30S ribosomal protein S1 [Pueribacillus theae]
MVDERNNELTLEIGQEVTGTVSKIEEKHALIDIGYKIEGVLPISELSSLHIDKISDVLSEGDELKLKVKKSSEDEIVLSKRAVDAEKAWEDLQGKYENKETFDVEIADVVKGGLVTDLGVRGFIPASLVENHFVEDFSDYKGKTLAVKIVEFDPDSNKVILSHRAVLDEEAEKKKKEILTSLQPGEVKTGIVQRITDFGAFVNIGGIDGLVHISQLAHHHVETPDEVVKEGDEVKVKILSVDVENERISLSIKATLPGPWEELEGKIKPGDELTGTVKRLVSFGAFVEIAPGVEGLVHISEISNRHIGTPAEVLKENQEVKVKVLDFNPEAKRVSLSIKALEQNTNDYSTTHKNDYAQHDSDTSTGFSVGDMIGDQLKKYK